MRVCACMSVSVLQVLETLQSVCTGADQTAELHAGLQRDSGLKLLRCPAQLLQHDLMRVQSGLVRRRSTKRYRHRSRETARVLQWGGRRSRKWPGLRRREGWGSEARCRSLAVLWSATGWGFLHDKCGFMSILGLVIGKLSLSYLRESCLSV